MDYLLCLFTAVSISFAVRYYAKFRCADARCDYFEDEYDKICDFVIDERITSAKRIAELELQVEHWTKANTNLAQRDLKRFDEFTVLKKINTALEQRVNYLEAKYGELDGITE